MSILNRIPIINSLINDQGFLRYFKNTSWLFFLKALRGFNTLIIGVILARYLGPNDYGILSYSLAFIFLFSSIAKMGLDTIVVRDLVKGNSNNDKILGTSFMLRLFGSFFIFLITLIISYFIHDTQEKDIVFVLSFTLLFLSFSVFDFYFQAKVLMKLSAYSNIIAVIFSILLKLILVYYKASLEVLVYAFLLEHIILSCAYLYFYFKNGSTLINWQYNKQIAISLMRDSFPLLLSSVFIVVYMKIDQIMINSLLSSIEVGKYAAAAMLSEGFYFFPMIVAISLFPAIINAKESSKEKYHDRMKRLYQLMFYSAIFLSILISVFSNLIISTFFGAEYLDASNILRIHIWACVFVFIGVASTRWLITENLQLYSTVMTAIGAISNIILNYILIPKYGIVGSAWATVISYGLSGYFLYFIFEKTRSNFYLVNKSIFSIR